MHRQYKHATVFTYQRTVDSEGLDLGKTGPEWNRSQALEFADIHEHMLRYIRPIATYMFCFALVAARCT